MKIGLDWKFFRSRSNRWKKSLMVSGWHFLWRGLIEMHKSWLKNSWHKKKKIYWQNFVVALARMLVVQPNTAQIMAHESYDLKETKTKNRWPLWLPFLQLSTEFEYTCTYDFSIIFTSIYISFWYNNYIMYNEPHTFLFYFHFI